MLFSRLFLKKNIERFGFEKYASAHAFMTYMLTTQYGVNNWEKIKCISIGGSHYSEIQREKF